MSLAVGVLSVPTNQTLGADVGTGQKQHFFAFTAVPHLFSLAPDCSCLEIWGFLLQIPKSKFPFLQMEPGAYMAVIHTGNNTAWGFLYCRSWHKGKSQALSAPTRRSLTHLPAMVAHPTHSPSHAVESCPIGQVAAHRACFACTPKEMSTAPCRNSW